MLTLGKRCGGPPPPPPPPMTVTCPGWTGVKSMGNYLTTCSLFPDQDRRGKERGRQKLMRVVQAPIFLPKDM